MKSPFGLDESVLNHLKKIFRKHQEVERVIIYGSRSKGNYSIGSDIDLTMIAPNLTTSELFEIENEIDDLLLPYKVDLSLFHQIENQNLIQHIQHCGQSFYERSA